MQATTTRHQVVVDQAFTANGDTYRPGCIATIEPSAPLSAGDYIAAITPAGRLEVLHVRDNGAGLSYHTTTPKTSTQTITGTVHNLGRIRAISKIIR